MQSFSHAEQKVVYWANVIKGGRWGESLLKALKNYLKKRMAEVSLRMGNPSDHKEPRAIKETPNQRHPENKISPSAYNDKLKNIIRALEELGEVFPAVERKLQQQQRELQDLRICIKEIEIRRTNNRD